MSKIICDICGTTYQDTAERCPICGCSREAAASLLGEDLLAADLITKEPKAKAGKFTPKKREIFDFDEVNSDDEEELTEEVSYEQDDDDEEYEEEPRHNTFVVILLTVLIVALLAVAGFLFIRYFLPNIKGEETVPPTTTAYQEPETTAAPTQLEIPCQNLALTSGTANLTQEGQYFLLHVIAMPEDTTDEIIFSSADESIATVTADGKITAVSEGETVIYITCGSSQLSCPVVCNFSGEVVPAETIAAETVVTTEPEETVAEETTPAEDEDSDEPEETEETTEPTKATVAPGDVVLKLKKTDIMLGVYYEFTLELDCELEPTDVEWSSEHPHIATVDENGVVTAKKDGVTDIIVKYGDQEVRCKVRCSY